ncbi:transporter substrate-binding domain-containing protein [Arhodomonas aquaeolei]|uniref:transporter substrate-binding domain-containing protein n=1 Tax=Arhodomonas aquaeolei TaxID=2369 RepID=UPI00036DD789|nr:transporter substrate-binding domain-containing protein [Arhodomonas aquaeolei]
MKSVVPIGILFSTQGPYGTVSRAMRDGAMLALEEVNADDRFDFRLEPHVQDPEGVPAAYLSCAQRLLREEGIKHVVGCYTSSSRKEIIPSFEKHDALLWYPSHYEGFETNDNVIYTGAAPNHHVLPLMDYVLRHVGRDIYCVGSNYVWAWENHRIVRELTQVSGGRILGERYLQVHDCDVDRIIDEILDRRPSFVLNMLIGESSYAFYRAFAEARRSHEALHDTVIGSCTLCEPELAEIGASACGGHLSSSVYFSTVETRVNQAFRDAYRRRFGERAVPCADAEASYNTVHLLARALTGTTPSEIEAVKRSLYGVAFAAPQGQVSVDSENNHSFLVPRLGVSRSDGTFDIVRESAEPVRPDPYLVWVDGTGVWASWNGRRRELTNRPRLRVIR